MPTGISVPEIESWRKQLPLSDLDACIRALYAVLQDLHQSHVSPEVRSEILSILRPTFSYLCQSLQNALASNAILTSQQEALLEGMNQLHFEMLRGYKQIIQTVQKRFFTNKNLLMSALQSAMLYCEKLILFAYEHHQQAPFGAWQNFHDFFVIAQNKHVASQSLLNATDWGSRLNTLQDVYKSCLLFVIANPSRFSRDEMIQLTYAVEEWAPLVILGKRPRKLEPMYMVDLMVDSPPLNTQIYSYHSEEFYYIIMDNLIEHLNKLLKAKQVSNEEEQARQFSVTECALPYTFVELLLSTWSRLAERSDNRYQAQGKIAISLGLNASHWFIQQGILPNLCPTKDTNKEQIKPHDYFNCQLVNQSEGGYCLKWIFNENPQLRCGNIIILERLQSENNPTWAVGTIRWLQDENKRTIYMGIQLLSLEARAVMIIFEDKEASRTFPALLLPDQMGRGKPMTLLTSLLPFRAEQIIKLEYEGKLFTVKLKRNYSLSPTYHEFEIEPMDALMPHFNWRFQTETVKKSIRH